MGSIYCNEHGACDAHADKRVWSVSIQACTGNVRRWSIMRQWCDMSGRNLNDDDLPEGGYQGLIPLTQNDYLAYRYLYKSAAEPPVNCKVSRLLHLKTLKTMDEPINMQRQRMSHLPFNIRLSLSNAKLGASRVSVFFVSPFAFWGTSLN
ncbi:hypothetical protein [Marinobacter persicus]|uniref:hypothetical protein n=1 Tax=Marinobacter persicus TaxID=930118 RepID=UPI000B2DA0D4|nr:hypothetical protein [Marinobacter persicus]